MFQGEVEPYLGRLHRPIVTQATLADVEDQRFALSSIQYLFASHLWLCIPFLHPLTSGESDVALGKLDMDVESWVRVS